MYTKDSLQAFCLRISDLDSQGLLPSMFHIPWGNENELIEIFKNIHSEDFVLSYHRNWYHALLKGISEADLEELILNGKSMFVYSKKHKFLCSAIIGGTPGIAAGISMAASLMNKQNRVWCFVSDGIEDSGHFYEAVRFCHGFNLPCTFIIEDNDSAVGVTQETRWGKSSKYNWPPNVHRYTYSNGVKWPHIRTHYKPDINLLKANQISDQKAFPDIPSQRYTPGIYSEPAANQSYFKAVVAEMTHFDQEGYYFIGYGLKEGLAGNTLVNVDPRRIIETPVAENLMVGLSTGMSIMGLKVLLYFERHDFILCGIDALVNHLDKIRSLSSGQFCPSVTIRTVVNDNNLIYSGPTHSQDFTVALRSMLSMNVIEPKTATEVKDAYAFARSCADNVLIVERKSLWYS